MKHISISERILVAQYHNKEREIKELKEQLEQYKESLRTMKDNLTEVKELNKVLVNQISSLSLQLKS
jgi:predicted  nucleic acid-binding Zn-ribbon protein